jgi:uncharacterized protein (DUF885 family)
MTEPADHVVALADELWAHLRSSQPQFSLNVGEPVSRIPHGSATEAEQAAALGRNLLRRLDDVDTPRLSTSDLSTATVVRELAGRLVSAEQDHWWFFPVAPYQIYQWSVLGHQLFQPYTFTSAEDADRYLALAADIAALIRAMRPRLAGQAERGVGMPRPALPGFRTAMRAQRASTSEFLRVDAGRVAGLAPAARGALLDGVDAIVENELLPAFDDLLAYLDGPGEQSAVDGIGLGRYDGGEGFYRTLVRRHATYDISPEEVHKLGLAQVELITEQMAEVRRTAGFDGDEAAYRRVLEADPRYYATSPDGVAATYHRHLAAIEPKIDQWFRVTPHTGVAAERLDPSLEAGMTFGYYEPPIAANPVGRYRFNGSRLADRPQISAAVLIFHELVPGHHYHLGRQAENTALHPLRSQGAAMAFWGYTEGWAEYASSLGFEMGLYEDPWDRYGTYVHQRFVAQRLVVDTGVNLLGWSEEKARAYMLSTTMTSPAQVATEILRYGTDLPAQALAYRLGSEKLWQLRRRAEHDLGSRFDIRGVPRDHPRPGRPPAGSRGPQPRRRPHPLTRAHPRTSCRTAPTFRAADVD